MEITYLAHSCFKIKGKDLTVVIDPYEPKQTGYKLPKLTCDVLLVSHDHFDHNYVEGVSEYKHLFNSPGEYEVSGVYIQGYASYHDTSKGQERGKNTMFLVEMEDLTILHLGDLGHELPQDTLEIMPDVDVLLVPVGGEYTIDAQVASKVISSLEPGYVVPMHYSTPALEFANKLDGIEKFLDVMGSENVTRSDKLKVSRKSEIPEETEIFLIEPVKA